MLLTGDMIDAARARELGLINRVAPEAELDSAVGALAGADRREKPADAGDRQGGFYRQAEMDLAAAYAYAAEVMTRNMMARTRPKGSTPSSPNGRRCGPGSDMRVVIWLSVPVLILCFAVL